MYIKVVFKRYDKQGDRVMEYRMVESYRTVHGVRQQNILHLGNLSELPKPEQKKELGKRIDEIVRQKVTGQLNFLSSENPVIEQLAQKYADEIIEKNKIDTGQSNSYEYVNTDTIRNENIVEIGAEWLCYQALDQLQFKGILTDCKFSEEEIHLAYTHIISRAVHPASELATNRWIKQNSGVCEITNYPIDKMTKDKLYGMSHKLFENKEIIERRLSTKTNELFDIEDKIIIYDLTNTYFEGRMVDSEIAKFGRSKEKRNDAKLIVLAMVVNEQGFIKYSGIFEGNTADSKTIEKIIDDLSKSTSSLDRKPIIVMDAGISSKANLALIKNKGYDYICVSRSGMSKYTIDPSTVAVSIKDKKDQEIKLQIASVKGCSDQYIEVHSKTKALKEKSMNKQFKDRFENGLQQIQASLTKPRGIKTPQKVSERLGRLKQKYTSVSKYYEIKQDIQEDKVKAITWQIRPLPVIEGKYLLRTSLKKIDEKLQWTIYNTIREIESTFRTLKTDLDLRPIYHKTDKASKAHLHLGLLAYWVVNTVRYQLKKQGDNQQWRDIVQLMNTQKIVTTRLECADEKIVFIRKVSEPTPEVVALYKKMNYKKKAFTQRKVVGTPTILPDIPLIEKQQLSSA